MGEVSTRVQAVDAAETPRAWQAAFHIPPSATRPSGPSRRFPPQAGETATRYAFIAAFTAAGRIGRSLTLAPQAR